MRKHDCEVCKAKDQTITALAEQIDWLRMQLGTPWLERRKHDIETQQSYNPLERFSPVDNSAWESDEESDIRFMESQGLIPPEAARAALEQMGALNTEIQVDGI